MSGEIIVACNIAGGFNNIFPVGKQLKKGDFRVVWVAEKKSYAERALLEAGEFPKVFELATEVVKTHPNPAAVITGFSEDKKESIRKLEWELIRRYGGICPTIMIQDSWEGHVFIPPWDDGRVRPDMVVVNDEIGASIIRKAWPDFGGKISVTGFPSLDIYKDVNFEQEADIFRKKNGLGSIPVLFFAGTVSVAGEVITELVRVLSGIEEDVCLAVKPHPAMKERSSEQQKELWREAVNVFSRKERHVLVDVNNEEMMGTLSAARAVFTDVSTLGWIKALMRGINVWMLYPEIGMAQYRKDVGFKMEEPPMITAGCSVLAGNNRDLEAIINLILSGSGTLEKMLRPNQEKVFKLDGKNTERAVNIIRNLIK